MEQDQKAAVVQHKMDQEIQVVLEVEREDLLFLQVVVEFLDKVLMVEIMVVQVRLIEVVLVVGVAHTNLPAPRSDGKEKHNDIANAGDKSISKHQSF